MYVLWLAGESHKTLDGVAISVNKTESNRKSWVYIYNQKVSQHGMVAQVVPYKSFHEMIKSGQLIVEQYIKLWKRSFMQPSHYVAKNK